MGKEWNKKEEWQPLLSPVDVCKKERVMKEMQEDERKGSVEALCASWLETKQRIGRM